MPGVTTTGPDTTDFAALSELLRAWAQTTGWQFHAEGKHRIGVHWNDETTEVTIAFSPNEPAAELCLDETGEGYGGLFRIGCQDRPADLLELVGQSGPPTPATFRVLLRSLAEAFAEVHDQSEGGWLPVNPAYLDSVRWSSTDEPPALRDGRAGLLAAIGTALRLPGEFREWPLGEPGTRNPDSPRYGIEVLAGAVDANRDRVAWVERHVFPPDDGDCDPWVAVWLRIAGNGVRGIPRVQGWVYFDEPGRCVSVPLTDGARRPHPTSVAAGCSR